MPGSGTASSRSRSARVGTTRNGAFGMTLGNCVATAICCSSICWLPSVTVNVSSTWEATFVDTSAGIGAGRGIRPAKTRPAPICTSKRNPSAVDTSFPPLPRHVSGIHSVERQRRPVDVCLRDRDREAERQVQRRVRLERDGQQPRPRFERDPVRRRPPPTTGWVSGVCVTPSSSITVAVTPMPAPSSARRARCSGSTSPREGGSPTARTSERHPGSDRSACRRSPNATIRRRRTWPDRSRSPPAAAAYVPAPMSGSVRITGVVFAGMSSIDDSTSSGGETCMFQSAPTSVCAASSWLVRTIAR